MPLQNRDNLHIKAVNGEKMKVFAEALRSLKDDSLKTIEQNTEGRKFTASDFTWDPSTKATMRETASQIISC